jgi:hypothetical protein
VSGGLGSGPRTVPAGKVAELLGLIRDLLDHDRVPEGTGLDIWLSRQAGRVHGAMYAAAKDFDPDLSVDWAISRLRQRLAESDQKRDPQGRGAS